MPVLRRLESGETPHVLHAFCSGGGDTDSARRSGGETFVRGGDEGSGGSSSRPALALWRDGGPSVQVYSTVCVAGEARQGVRRV